MSAPRNTDEAPLPQAGTAGWIGLAASTFIVAPFFFCFSMIAESFRPVVGMVGGALPLATRIAIASESGASLVSLAVAGLGAAQIGLLVASAATKGPHWRRAFQALALFNMFVVVCLLYAMYAPIFQMGAPT